MGVTMKAIKNFFTGIGNFLTAAEDYMDDRVRTGKFTGDIRFLMGQLIELLHSLIKQSIHVIRSSSSYKQAHAVLNDIWQDLLRFKTFAFIAALTGDGIKILVRFYSEIFVTFAITFPTIILLLNFFETSIVLFFIAFLPIILFNTYCVTALYYCMQQRMNGASLSLWDSLQKLLPRFFSVVYVFAVQAAIVLILGVIYFILSLFGSYVFELFGIAWGDAFLYWFLVIFLGILFLIGTFVITLFMHQAYFSSLFEKAPIQEALYQGWGKMKSHAGRFFFLYLLLYLFFGALIWRSALSYLHLGITISSYFFLHLSLFLGFLLRCQFPDYQMQSNTTVAAPELPARKKSAHSPLFPTIIILGTINYVLAAFLIVQEYPTISTFVKKQQQQVLLAQTQNRYTNELYRYTLEYPETWAIYEWDDGAVTFYHNYTGTVSGGVWLRITVSQHSEEFFRKLYEYRPGVVAINEQTQDVTTKISNISIQGYEGVVYAETINGQPYNEYQTHYLIHKGDQSYDLMFTTLSNDTDSYNSTLFEQITGTFRFIE